MDPCTSMTTGYMICFCQIPMVQFHIIETGLGVFNVVHGILNTWLPYWLECKQTLEVG